MQAVPNFIASYRRYPTGLKLQYAAGCLPKSIARHIARSTRRRWKSLGPESVYVLAGAEVFDSESAKLMAVLIENRRLKGLRHDCLD